MIYCYTYEQLKKVCYRLRSEGYNNYKIIKTRNKEEYTVIKGKYMAKLCPF